MVKQIKVKSRVFCFWRLSKGTVVPLSQFLTDHDEVELGHVSISINSEGVQVKIADSESVNGNFNVPAIDSLPWSNVGLWFMFKANAKWVEWFEKDDDYTNIRNSIQLIMEKMIQIYTFKQLNVCQT